MKCMEKVWQLKLTAVDYERGEKLMEEVNKRQSFIYSSKCSILVSPCIFVSDSKKLNSARLYFANC